MNENMNASSTLSVLLALTITVLFSAASFVQQEQPPVQPACYYIDPVQGSHSNPGTSEEYPLKSFPVNGRITFHPGDSICFKRGTEYTGPLWISSSGEPGKYLVLSAYGDTSLPAPAFTNPVFEQGNFGNCIRVTGSYVLIENLYFHHTAAVVSGDYQTDGFDTWQSGAVYIDKTAGHCIVRKNEFVDCIVGVKSYGKNTLITHNYLHDCNRVLKQWGWGPIGIWLGNDFQEVSYNRIFNYRAEDPRINWPNGVGGGADGGAMEIDDARFDKSHITIHHNYTRDCQGFLEVTWSDVKARPDYEGFIIHHNISDDYQQFLALWRGTGCRIENNTIIRRKVNANDWGVFNITQDHSHNLIRNNLIVVEKDIPIFNTGLKTPHDPENIISHNLYYAASGNLVMGREGPGDDPVYGSPLLVNYSRPRSSGDYRPTTRSCAIDRGMDLGYLTDFRDHHVPSGSAPDIGAFEFNAHDNIQLSDDP